MMAARPGLDVFAAALRMVQGRVGADGKPLGVIARTANGLFADALVAAGVPRGPKGVFFTDTYVKGAGGGAARLNCWWCLGGELY
jgi:hypothetical protein